MEYPQVELSDIQRFYKGGTVFLTGATGFIGKLILEKILRTLPVRKVFILVREKENESPSQRVQQMFESPIFDGLKWSNPEVINKVVTLEGNCALPMLGLGQENVETIIKEVDVILHCAAAVWFDGQLKNAVRVNVKATRDLVEIAKKIKKLRTFVYMGAAFSNFETNEIKEEIYPCKIEAQELIAACESLDNDTVDSLTKTLVADWPNVGTFTKQVSEDFLKRHTLNIPICIVRPTIVISTYTEPVNAFTDNELSLAGLVMANTLGTCHINYYKNGVLDIVPVDYVVNAFIAAGWYTGDNFRKHRGDMQVYNISSSQDNPITQDEIWSMINHYNKGIPSSHLASFPCHFRTTCKHNYLILRFFFHTLVAMIADYVLSLQGKKPMYVDRARKLHDIQEAWEPFTTTEFFVHVANTHKLLKRMSFQDRELFNFDMGTITWDAYFAQYVKGLRIYLLKDPMETISAGKKRFAYLKKVFIVLLVVVTILLYAAGKILLFRVLPFILWIVSSILQDLVCQ
ncbi:fatty acyl-CoA reductase wat-like [Euwallacea fornicatus]|uniref:fatty acyl-CoA reductase wat-like n=1 Tax=Euwallacea fornicatus TaxID=995702 RepID=UPI00338DF742